MMIGIGRFWVKRNLNVLRDSLQMKLFRRADGDPVTPTAWPFKEDENSLLSVSGWLPLGFQKKMGDKDV
jgi:hypothetical protein